MGHPIINYSPRNKNIPVRFSLQYRYFAQITKLRYSDDVIAISFNPALLVSQNENVIARCVAHEIAHIREREHSERLADIIKELTGTRLIFTYDDPEYEPEKLWESYRWLLRRDSHEIGDIEFEKVMENVLW